MVRSRLHLSLLGFLLTAGVTACAHEQPMAIAFLVRDSAGLLIADNLQPVATLADTCRISSEPMLDLGVTAGDPAHELYRAFDGTRFPDGRVAVVNEGAQEIRVFDAEGGFLYKFGRDGEGPGEFRRPYQIWRIREDSLVVFDRATQRLSWFDNAGTFSRVSALRPMYMNPPEVIEVVPSVLVSDHFFEPVEQGFKPQTMFVVRHSQDGGTADTAGAYPLGSLGRVGDPELRIASGPVFQSRTAVAASGDTLFVGRGDEWEIEVRTTSGDLLGLWRWIGRSRDVTTDHLEARERETRERFAETARPGLVEALLDKSIPVADRFPTLSDLYVDAGGHLWVEEFRRPGEDGPNRWLVFDAEGKFACHASIPTDMRLFEIGRDYVLGMERDEIDVEHVRLYSLGRPATPTTADDAAP